MEDFIPSIVWTHICSAFPDRRQNRICCREKLLIKGPGKRQRPQWLWLCQVGYRPKLRAFAVPAMIVSNCSAVFRAMRSTPTLGCLGAYLGLFFGYFRIILFTLDYLLWFPCKLQFQIKKKYHISNMDINATTDAHKNNPRGKISSGVYGVRVRAMWKLQGYDLWKILDVLCSQLYSTCVILSCDLVRASKYFFLAPIQVGLHRVSGWLRVGISSL